MFIRVIYKGVMILQNDKTEFIDKTIGRYSDMLFRISIIMLQNYADSEDAVQNTFIKYFTKAPVFSDDEHKKAWLITVCTNCCQDILRRRNNQPHTDLDKIKEVYIPDNDSGILEALLLVEEKHRLVLTLHYLEGYSVREIAAMIGKTQSAVKMRLQKGRRLLKEIYEREFC